MGPEAAALLPCLPQPRRVAGKDDDSTESDLPGCEDGRGFLREIDPEPLFGAVAKGHVGKGSQRRQIGCPQAAQGLDPLAPHHGPDGSRASRFLVSPGGSSGLANHQVGQGIGVGHMVEVSSGRRGDRFDQVETLCILPDPNGGHRDVGVGQFGDQGVVLGAGSDARPVGEEDDVATLGGPRHQLPHGQLDRVLEVRSSAGHQACDPCGEFVPVLGQGRQVGQWRGLRVESGSADPVTILQLFEQSECRVARIGNPARSHLIGLEAAGHARRAVDHQKEREW